MTQKLGLITGGSLSHGLDARLDPGVNSEDVKVGQYAVVQGTQQRFFCVVSDLKLAALDPSLTTAPPDLDDPLTREILQGTGTYGEAHLVPTLTWGLNG